MLLRFIYEKHLNTLQLYIMHYKCHSVHPILAFWEGGWKRCLSNTNTTAHTYGQNNLIPLTRMPLWEEAGLLTHREKRHKEMMMRDACWEVTVCLNCKCIMNFNLSGSSPMRFRILHHHTSLQKTGHVHLKRLQASGTHTNCHEMPRKTGSHTHQPHGPRHCR